MGLEVCKTTLLSSQGVDFLEVNAVISHLDY